MLNNNKIKITLMTMITITKLFIAPNLLIPKGNFTLNCIIIYNLNPPFLPGMC